MLTSEWMKAAFTDSFFDWYQVTFTEKVHHETLVREALTNWDLSSVRPARPRFPQYERACEIHRGSHVILHICWGGHNANVHLLSTGSISHEVALWLRQNWLGSFAVSRADVRIDTIEPGMFDYLLTRCKDASDSYKTTRSMVGDWDVLGSPSGRTYYIGAKSSVCQARLYEKGKKDGGSKDWVRLEIQVRPSKQDGKIKASYWQAQDFWKASSWSAYLHGAVMYKAVKERPDTLGTTWRASDQERALIALVTQYGKTMEEIASSLPDGWASLGSYLQLYRQTVLDQKKAVSGFGQSPYESVLSKIAS